MLQSLRISHFAIIDSLAVEFEPGLNVITGETGAGKSILIDAVNLLLGGRASSDLIRTGEDEARVEALFYVRDDQTLGELEEMGIEVSGGELAIQRVVSRAGRNRVLINGSPATVAMLGRLSRHLIDVSGQHEHHGLLDPEQHRAVVDAFGEHTALLTEMSEAYTAYGRARDAADALAAKERDRVQREEFVRFQLTELENASPKPSEDDELLREREILGAAEDLAEAATFAHQQLYAADGAIAEQLVAVLEKLSRVAAIDPALRTQVEALGAVRIEVEEAARGLADYSSGIEHDPNRLDAVETRLALLQRLQKKHGCDQAGLVALTESLTVELEELGSFDSILEKRRAETETAHAAAVAAAGRLTKARIAAGKKLTDKVRKHLRELGMKAVVFQAEVTALEDVTSGGADALEFLISPNKGEEPKPLAKIASGGELSRVTLALKCVLLSDHPVSVYVFDEVDAGIGGAIAEVVGRKISRVAGSHQVLCVTHLPQIAVFAGSHYRVTKGVARGRTRTRVDHLDERTREEEIARMLGGVEITAQTRAHAREMLARVV